MLHIRTIEQLKECLFSDKVTGIFITPVQDFVKSGDIIKPENRSEYYLKLDDLHSINFQISENIIVFKGYNIKVDKRYVYHRPDNLPATFFFLKNGDLNTVQWFFHGHARRDHFLQPVSIDRKNDRMFTFQYSKSEDGFFEASYIIFDKGTKNCKGKVIDLMFRQRGVNINAKSAKTIFPAVTDISFEDCYDLSKRIITDDELLVYRMASI
jgi:hypothetical protein